jgi:uncharacterized membrane protein YheB (UPF0754 family)
MDGTTLSEVIVSFLLGGGVGYLTNDLAINMLFKKYFGKFGGVIKDHYGEFIQSMSQLVEEDLVNHKTLESEFSSDAFKEVLQKWIGDILLKELPKNSGTIRLEDIPGMDQSIQNLTSLAKTVQKPLFQGLYIEISKKKLHSIISKEQYRYIINENIPLVFAEDKKSYEDDIERLFCNFLSLHPINTLISTRAVLQITENINKVIQKTDFSKFDDELNNAYEEFLDAINIDKLLADIVSELGDMRWSDFVKDSKHLSRELIARLLDFIKSDEGQNLLLQIVMEILKSALKINLKIDEVLSPQIKNDLVRFINDKLPGIINKIVGFIRESKLEIEEIIDTALNRELNSAGIGGKILLFIKTVFIDSLVGNLAEKVNVVKIIIDAINNKGDEIGSQLSQQILNFIETNTIGDIIGWACDNKAITPKGITDIINFNIKDLAARDYDVIDNFLNEKIGGKLGVIDFSILKTKVMPLFFEKMKREYIYTERFKAAVKNGIDGKLKEISEKKINDLFDLQSIPIHFNEKVIQEKLIRFGDKLLSEEIRSLLGKNAADNLSIDVEPFWRNNKQHELNEFYKIAQNESFYGKIANGILDVLNQNMESILTGNVSAIVNKELSKSNPDQINDMVKDFMGKELKPINFIGLALGAIIGGISVFVAAKFSVPNEMVWYMFPAYAAIFASVGMLTNYVAIRMLFKPYKSFTGLNFSPFVGVVAAKKPEFANNISKFVKENTLNDAAILETFDSNKDNLKKGFDKYVVDSNYGLIDNFLGEQERLTGISIFIFNAIKKYFKENSHGISKIICGFLKDAVEKGRLDLQIPAIKNAIMVKIKEADMASYVNNLLQSEIAGKNLSQYSKILSNLVNDRIIGFFESVSNDLTVDKIKNIINEQNNAFINYTKSNTFEDLVGAKTVNDAVNAVLLKTKSAIDAVVDLFVDYLRKQQFDPNQKLSEVFGGSLSGFVKKNIDFALNIIIDAVKKNRDSIANVINDKIDDAPLLLRPLLWAADVKNHLSRLVDMLIDNEMPKFIKSKEEDLLDVANSILDNRLGSLGFKRESFNQESVKNAVVSVLGSASVQSSLTHLVGIIVRQYAKIPIESLLKILNIRNIRDIIAIIDPLLRSGVSNLQDSIRNEQVAVISGKYTAKIILSAAGDVTIKDLLMSVEVNKELGNIFALLKNSDDAMQTVADIVERVLYRVLGNYSFYNDAILCKDLTLFFDTYTENEWALLQNVINPVLKDILARLNTALTKQTKDAILKEYLFEAVLESCEYNFSNIIHAIDVQTVVKREINNMHPKQVEKMFYKFAGRYFNKLIIYGWIGSFGGLISYGLNCLLKLFVK